MRGVGILTVAVLLSLASLAAFAEEGDARPAVVPYRPTISTPAQLSVPGWLEGELGGLYAKSRDVEDGSARRASVPYTLKYAFTDDWGLRVGGELLVHATDADGTRATGFGDTAVVAKRRFAIDESSAFGVEIGAAFATARRGLSTGSGRTDWSANLIHSADSGAWHTDLNLINTRLGVHDEGRSRLQTVAAAAASHPIDDRWGATAEWSGSRQHGAHGTAQVLGALTWSARRDLVFDVGGARGLNHATPTWQAFVGATVLLGRL